MNGGRDDLVDKLIANNAARPRPGMEKPDLTMLAMAGRVDEKRKLDGSGIKQRKRRLPLRLAG